MKEQNYDPALAALAQPEKDQKTEVAPGLVAEEIRALFFDTTALREPPYRIYRLDTEGYRYYYRFGPDGEPEFYPSVTTLLGSTMPTSPFLIEWMLNNGKEQANMKRDLAASYGTFMHGEFEKLIISRSYDFDAVPAVVQAYMERENVPEGLFNEWVVKIRKDVLAFAAFVREWDVQPLAVEIGLVHPKHKYAGAIDLPCRMTDPRTEERFAAIVDFKSGRKGFWEEHELQLGLYRDMWNENFPQLPVVRIFNFSPKDWRKSPTYNLKEQTNSPNLQKLPYLLALAAIEDDKRESTVTIVRGRLDLDSGPLSNNILTLSLAELIKTKAEKPAEGEKRPVDGPKESQRVNIPTEPARPVSGQNAEKLPWEKDIADGTGIEVEKTDDGVKVTARYFEPAPAQTAKDNLLNDEIEL